LARQLHIAWLGPGPARVGGVPAVATELIAGLAELGHRIECYCSGSATALPQQLRDRQNITFAWSPTRWRWNRWYSRAALPAFATGLASRAYTFLQLRRSLARQHAVDPFDVIYQFSNIETLAVSARLAKEVPLVIHPETHSAGELRWMLRERRLAGRCQPWYRSVAVTTVFAFRSVLQRLMIRRARLLICISSVFRDHLVHDYHFPREATVVIPNPIELARFDPARHIDHDGRRVRTALVVGRIALRKGIDQIVLLSQILHHRRVAVRLRIIGGHSLWSDYRPLLDALDPVVASYVGAVAAEGIPDELYAADMLVQASKYEPFGLTVGEALAAGIPVIATGEVGAVEGTTAVSTTVIPVEDPEALADAVEAMAARLDHDPQALRDAARADAERLFCPQRVCQAISNALETLVGS
jgi:glycosyltransferase involved in cell wall biosynthesis